MSTLTGGIRMLQREMTMLQSGIRGNVTTMGLLWERNVNDIVCQKLIRTLALYGIEK